MIDPNGQKKGGFGAFVGREHEAHDVREAAEKAEAAKQPKDGAPASDVAPTPARPA